MFKDKVLLVTGGTGSFGNAVLRRFLDSDVAEIRILSRDEKKQDDMRKRYDSAWNRASGRWSAGRRALFQCFCHILPRQA